MSATVNDHICKALKRSSVRRFWGDRGYVHISRDHHGCGIASDAIYAVVERNNDIVVTAEE